MSNVLLFFKEGSSRAIFWVVFSVLNTEQVILEIDSHYILCRLGLLKVLILQANSVAWTLDKNLCILNIFEKQNFLYP